MDPFVVLAAASQVARTIKLGSGVLLVQQRDPIQTAKLVASIDQVSQGRFLFGVGGGWNRDEMENHGTVYATRFKRMRESVEAMKEIWTAYLICSIHRSEKVRRSSDRSKFFLFPGSRCFSAVGEQAIIPASSSLYRWPMIENAPGGPGIPPTWTSSAKDMVGCALGISRLWFTLGFGIVNEVYYPRVDIPQIRDLGFIIADGKGFWAEVKRVANYHIRLLAPGVPAVEVVHEHERYTLRLRIAPSVRRDVLAIECRLEGDPKLRLYALLAPHLGATGYGNRAKVVMYRRRLTLCAEQGPFGVALAAVDEKQRDAIGRASAGYVGSSDGWQDFRQNGRMTWEYQSAGPGNVALTAELPHRAVLALGFGSSAEAAATLAISSLLQPFDSVLQQHIALWQTWQ